MTYNSKAIRRGNELREGPSEDEDCPECGGAKRVVCGYCRGTGYCIDADAICDSCDGYRTLACPTCTPDPTNFIGDER